MSIEVVNSAIKWKETISKLALSTKIPTVKNLVKKSTSVSGISRDNIKISSAITATTVTSTITVAADNNVTAIKENDTITDNRDNKRNTINVEGNFNKEKNSDYIPTTRTTTKTTSCKTINENDKMTAGNYLMILDSSPERSLSLPPIPGLIPIRKSNISATNSINTKNSNSGDIGGNNSYNLNNNSKKSSSQYTIKNINFNEQKQIIENNTVIEQQKDIDEDGFVVNKIYVEKLSNTFEYSSENKIHDNNDDHNLINQKEIPIKNSIKIKKCNKNNISKKIKINKNKGKKEKIRLKISCKQKDNKRKISKISNKNVVETFTNHIIISNIKKESITVNSESKFITTKNKIDEIEKKSRGSNNATIITTKASPSSDRMSPIMMPQLFIDNQRNQLNVSGVNNDMNEICNQKLQQKKCNRRFKVEIVTPEEVEQKNEKQQQQEQQIHIQEQNQQLNQASLPITDVSVSATVLDSNPTLSNENCVTSSLLSITAAISPPTPSVFQPRKSDRRRIPRDIFFVFEHAPRIKKGKTNSNNRKQGISSKGNSKSNALHPNNNENNSSSSSSSNKSVTQQESSPLCNNLNTSSKKFSNNQSLTSIINQTKQIPSQIKQMKKESHNNEEKNSENYVVPKVNPIFLWVKQDHTRIVEVRCEDYDKRNRIRLTKTANGWRAMPRTDPTTSRVVKLFPNPLVRIKPEFQRSNLNGSSDINNDDDKNGNKNLSNDTHNNSHSEKSNNQEQKPRLKVKSYPTFENAKNKMKQQHKNKKKKNKKSRKKNSSDESNKTITDDNLDYPTKTLLENEEIRELLSEEPKDVIVYESINHENEINEEELRSSKTATISGVSDEKSAEMSMSSLTTIVEQNNNKMLTIDTNLTKNVVQDIRNEIDLNSLSFIQNLQSSNISSPLSEPHTQTSSCHQNTQQNFIQSVTNSQQSSANTAIISLPPSTDHVDLTLDTFDPSVCNDVDTKQLKDLLDDPDLLQHCGDNGMSGEELIDSLVKRGFEDNHITAMTNDEEIHSKPSKHKQDLNLNTNYQQRDSTMNSLLVPTTTICLDDFDNEDDDLLMQAEPVEDIISRLGDSLTDSPKCLSFNEVGEIEDLNGELFQTSSQTISFNPPTTLEELSITIKDLEKSSESLNTAESVCKSLSNIQEISIVKNTTSTVTDKSTSVTKATTPSPTTMVSPDSCAIDELPKDLTCKKSNNIINKENMTISQSSNLLESQQPERALSRSSDAIQSPQPSGLPAVPPSPDLVHSKTTNKTIFLNQMLRQDSSSPKVGSSASSMKTTIQASTKLTKSTQQKEPLDLGKHRKSASPTVSCSEEANKNHLNSDVITLDDDNDDNIGCEPLEKRIKIENLSTVTGKKQTENLIEMLSSGKDPDPLTQLQLLIGNPEWKVPDPILVPKDRLSAVLMSPAREIPLLLTTRPELRLPEAFAYPAILQDPDILVISLAQLEAILQKHIELVNKAKSISSIPHVTIEPVSKIRIEKSKNEELKTEKISNEVIDRNLLNPLAAKLATNCLANDIDTATLAAFNQMLWLPYLGQMAPEIFKAIAGFSESNNFADLFSFLSQKQQSSQLQPQVQQQQQQQQQQHSNNDNNQRQTNLHSSSNSTGLIFQNPLEIALWQEALNQLQLQHTFGINSAASSNQQKEQQKKTIDPKPNANKSGFNLAAFFNQKAIENSRILVELQKSQQQTKSNSRNISDTNQSRKIQQNQIRENSIDNRNNNNSSRNDPNNLYCHPEARNHGKIKQQHYYSNHNHQFTSDQKPRVTCKSLTNLLQPERLMNATVANTTNSTLIDNKMSNLMAMPSFDFNSPGGLHHQQASQQSLQLQAVAISQQLNSQPLHHHSQFNANHLAAAAGATTVNNNSVGFNSNFLNGNHIANNSVTTAAAAGTVASSNHRYHHQQQQQSKVKVKTGSHLFDSAATQKRLLNSENVAESGNTGTDFDELVIDPTAHLWHPLFGSHQKSSYNSPWQWTTLTTAGE